MKLLRDRCLKCLRPVSECWCVALRPLEPPVSVVFLQHPKERRVPIGTARMAHLSLPGSELHVGTSFDEHPRVRQLVDAPDVRPMLLFPGPDAADPTTLEQPPTHLFVVDGTWSTAAKVVRRNAVLSALPKLGLTPAQPGRYRIRREPDEHGLATIEAVAQVLDALSGKPGAFDALLSPFEHMVESQLAHAASSKGRLRHGEVTKRRPTDALRKAWDELVVVQAEANHLPDTAELVHLSALRVATGQWFDSVVAPRRELGARTCRHTGLSPDVLAKGTSIDEAREAWRRFRGDSVLAGWGDFPAQLLEAESFGHAPWIDLRSLAGTALGRVTGGADGVREKLGAVMPEVQGAGRASRLAALHAAIARGLKESI